MSVRFVSIAAALLALVPALTGCGSYALRGRVIEGDSSGVFVVDPSDPRLKAPGVDGALLDLVLDPQRVSRKHAGRGVSNESGDFSVPVGEFGAGVLLFDALITAEKHGFIPAEEVLPLPGQDKRVLITLQRGIAPRTPVRENLRDEIRRYQN